MASQHFLISNSMLNFIFISFISSAVLLLSCPADGLSIAFVRPSTSARHILFTRRRNQNCNTSAQLRNRHHVASTTSWALRSANNEEENKQEIETAAAAVDPTQPKFQSIPQSATAPTPTQLMSMMGTSPRRVFLSAASSTAIALSANFFGVTSNLLEVLPEEFSEKTGMILCARFDAS